MARTGKYSDDTEKIPIQLAFTESTQKHSKVDLLYQKLFFLEKTLVPPKCFVPLLVIASQTEANTLLSSLECDSESLTAVGITFLVENDTELFFTERPSSLVCTSTTTDDIFARTDEYVFERLSFQIVPYMVYTLNKYLFKFQANIPGKI